MAITSTSTNFLNTPAGQALLMGGLNLAGGALSGYGQAQQADANRQLSYSQLLAQMLAQNQANDLSRGQIGLASTQMNPAAQAEALASALKKGSMLKSIRPASITAPDFLKGYVPQISGGVMSLIPQGGFGPEVTNALSPDAILASAKNFGQQQANVNPAVPAYNLGPTFGQAGTDATGDVEQYRAGRYNDLQSTREAQLQALQQAIGQDQKSQDDPSSGFWHKFAKYAGIAGAGIATALTGGAASPLLIGAIGAGSGAAAGWGSGGGAKGALLGAGMGAIPGIGAGLSKPASVVLSAGSALAPSLADPGGMSALGGGFVSPGSNIYGQTPQNGLPPGYYGPGGPSNDFPTSTVPGLPSLKGGKSNPYFKG